MLARIAQLESIAETRAGTGLSVAGYLRYISRG
jgi:hypothetical protein